MCVESVDEVDTLKTRAPFRIDFRLSTDTHCKASSSHHSCIAMPTAVACWRSALHGTAARVCLLMRVLRAIRCSGLFSDPSRVPARPTHIMSTSSPHSP